MGGQRQQNLGAIKNSLAGPRGSTIRGNRFQAAIGLQNRWSGAKTGRFNQANLVSPGGEFPTLVALNNDSTTGFDTNHPRPNPAKGCGLENFDHITRL